MSTQLATFASSNSPLKPLVVQTPDRGVFVQHPHAMAPNFGEIVKAVGRVVGEDSPVLVDSGAGTITELKPFQFLQAPAMHQYMARFDDTGTVLETYDIEDKSYDRSDRSVKEVIDAVVLVWNDGTLTPARMRLKTAKAGLVKGGVALAENFKLSASDSKIVAKYKVAPTEAWVTGLYTATYNKPKGKAYWVGVPTLEFAGEAVLKAYAAQSKSAPYLEAVSEVMTHFNRTVEMTLGLQKK